MVLISKPLATIIVLVNLPAGFWIGAKLVEWWLGNKPPEKINEAAVERLRASLAQEPPRFSEADLPPPDTWRRVLAVFALCGCIEVAVMTVMFLLQPGETNVWGLGRVGGAMLLSAMFCSSVLLLGVLLGLPIAWAYSSTRPDVKNRYRRVNQWLLGALVAVTLAGLVVSTVFRRSERFVEEQGSGSSTVRARFPDITDAPTPVTKEEKLPPPSERD